ncbi:hypothetical protein BH10CYA1_BH10CYA1_34370 [soil metagenome]
MLKPSHAPGEFDLASQNLSLLGLEIDDYMIDQQMGDGSLSAVFRGKNAVGFKAAFKLAKQQDLLTATPVDQCRLTKAIAKVTGGVMDVRPNTSSILKKQYSLLEQVHERELVRVRKLSARSELTYYEMNLLEGETLRQVMDRQPVSIDQMIGVARCLDKLSKNSFFSYHGDIKPENIMITEDGITMIDPGHFGPLDLENGSTMANCALTTAAYYPLLEPDDLLAFGLMLWEVVLGEAPLAKRGYSGESDLSRIGPNLLEIVKLQEMVGKYYLSSILDVPIPSKTHHKITGEAEKMLLKCLRLYITPAGKLELDSGFKSFSSIAGALAAMRLKGKQYFSAD